MVFEGAATTWVVVADNSLGFSAIGRALVHAHLYRKDCDTEDLRLAIVCQESDLETESACADHDIKVVTIPNPVTRAQNGEAQCGVCGECMNDQGPQPKCKTCVYLFGERGGSSIVARCTDCRNPYGDLPFVLNAISRQMMVNFGVRRERWPLGLCPDCRRSFRPADEAHFEHTYAGWIREEVRQGMVGADQLAEIAALGEDFIDFSLGKMKPYFK
jgi:hypothetical protein